MNLKQTFDFIHTALVSQTATFDMVNDTTFSEHHDEIIRAYQYYSDDELKNHTGTLILLKDKIEFHDLSDGIEIYHTLAEKNQKQDTFLIREDLINLMAKGDNNFSGLNLDGLDLEGLDFTDTNFSGSSLKDTDFNYSNLTRTNFEGCLLANANFTHCLIRDTNFSNTTLLETAHSNVRLFKGVVTIE